MQVTFFLKARRALKPNPTKVTWYCVAELLPSHVLLVWARNAKQQPDLFSTKHLASVASSGMQPCPSTVKMPEAIQLLVIEGTVKANVSSLITIPSW